MFFRRIRGTNTSLNPLLSAIHYKAGICMGQLLLLSVSGHQQDVNRVAS